MSVDTNAAAHLCRISGLNPPRELPITSIRPKPKEFEVHITRWIRQFSIRTRMICAVGVVLALLGGVGAVAVAGMVRIQDSSDQFIDTTFAASVKVSHVRDALGGVRKAEQELLARYETMDSLDEAVANWRKATALAKQQLDALTASRAELTADASLHGLQRYDSGFPAVLEKMRSGALTPSNVPAALKPLDDDLALTAKALDTLNASLLREATTARVSQRTLVRSTVTWFGLTLLAAVMIVVPLTWINVISICRPIDRARLVAERIATGDLFSSDRETAGQDEAAALLRSLLHMQEYLRTLVGQVRVCTDSIGTASTEIASSNADLSNRTEHAASSLQQTAASMEQLTGNVKQSAQSAHQANQLASSAAEVASRGGSVVSRVVTTMGEIHTSSKKIADIIGVIDSIAFQTNILALNAAVEAARAGDQGRGFAVVASEVRNLAQRSAAAAKEIKVLIGASVDSVESGSKLVTDAGQTMGEIVAAVERVSGIIGEITAAAAEQSEGIGQVNSAVNQLDEMTQRNASMVEHSATAAAALNEQASVLSQLVATFRLDGVAGVPAQPVAANPR
jgi:methyl-accepting chemotaxis protein